MRLEGSTAIYGARLRFDHTRSAADRFTAEGGAGKATNTNVRGRTLNGAHRLPLPGEVIDRVQTVLDLLFDINCHDYSRRNGEGGGYFAEGNVAPVGKLLETPDSVAAGATGGTSEPVVDETPVPIAGAVAEPDTGGVWEA